MFGYLTPTHIHDILVHPLLDRWVGSQHVDDEFYGGVEGAQPPADEGVDVGHDFLVRQSSAVPFTVLSLVQIRAQQQVM